MFKKEKTYLAWNHPTTSQGTCRWSDRGRIFDRGKFCMHVL